MRAAEGFNRDQTLELLTELGRRLSAAGVAGRLYIVGGAAIALELDTRRTTRDIDALFNPRTTVAAEAATMASELDLPAGWLRDAVRPFIPLPDDDPVALVVEGLQVALSSPANLLAMKMAAGRPQDLTDLAVLFEQLKIESPEKAVGIVERMYGEDSVVLTEPRESLLLLAKAVLVQLRATRARRTTK